MEKKIILVLLIVFAFVGCRKSVDVRVPPTPTDCRFGITEFNMEKRPFNPDVQAGYRVKKGKPVRWVRPNKNIAPQSYNVLLLDFDGHTVSETSWNTGTDIYCAGSGFTIQEIDAVFHNIANSFSEFNVVVTTSEKFYDKADPSRRMRLILTESWEWFAPAGGVAFRGSFKWKDESPCFVFTSLLGYNIHNVSVAGSHELGHTLGLTHQSQYDSNCNFVATYHPGGNGKAPIMGVAYYQPEALWWIGPTPYGCDKIQDDKAIIANTLF